MLSRVADSIFWMSRYIERAENVARFIDVVLYVRDTFQIIEHRYQKDDLLELSIWWQDRLRQSVNELPSAWIEEAFSKLALPPSPSPGG